MKLRPFAAALACLAACGENDPPGVVRRAGQPDFVQDFDKTRMDRAIAEAKATLGDFVRALEAKKGENFTVKKGYDGEFIWISDVRLVDGGFEGEIDNEPVNPKLPKLGQTVKVAKAEAVDWFYRENGRLRGGYTIVALVHGTPQQAAYEKNMGIDWNAYKFLKK